MTIATRKKRLELLGFIVSCSLLQGAASAQTKAGVSKSAATAAPAAAKKPAASSPAVSPKAAATAGDKSQAKPATPAAKSAVPNNLFATNDSAIIIVGGKSVKAGAVKQEFSDELARLSGPTKSGKIASRVPAPTIKEVKPDPMPGLAKGVFWQGPAVAIAALPQGKKQSASKDPAARTRGCKDAPPVIIELYQFGGGAAPKKARTLKPGDVVSIAGACFGEKQGSVEMNGPFGPSGKLSVVPSRWKDDEVIVQLPPMRGVLDGAMSVALTLPDGRRTLAEPAKFVATRGLVAVPAQSFSPSATLERTDTAEGFGAFFGIGSGVVVGSKPTLVTTPLTVSVDPSCSLESMTWDARVGAVAAVTGWDDMKAPNLANSQVQWYPQCTRTTTNYVITSSTTQSCRIAVDFHATALCPLGIGP